ncbi:MAG: hypothetical protein WC732_09135 [Candidatus Omnitrophota bacterium]
MENSIVVRILPDVTYYMTQLLDDVRSPDAAVLAYVCKVYASVDGPFTARLMKVAAERAQVGDRTAYIVDMLGNVVSVQHGVESLDMLRVACEYYARPTLLSHMAYARNNDTAFDATVRIAQTDIDAWIAAQYADIEQQKSGVDRKDMLESRKEWLTRLTSRFSAVQLVNFAEVLRETDAVVGQKRSWPRSDDSPTVTLTVEIEDTSLVMQMAADMLVFRSAEFPAVQVHGTGVGWY